MNSIKNTIVTVTLLAVSYGAYVVLSEPPNDGQLTSGDNWNQGITGAEDGAPVVELPQTALTSTQQDPSMVEMPQHGGHVGHAPADPNAMQAQYPSGAGDPVLPPVDATVGVDTAPPTHYEQSPPQEYPTTSLPALPETHTQATPPGQTYPAQTNPPPQGVAQQPVGTQQPGGATSQGADAFEGSLEIDSIEHRCRTNGRRSVCTDSLVR